MNITTTHVVPSTWDFTPAKSLRDWKAEQAPYGVTFSEDPEPPLTPRHLKRPTLKLEFQGKFVAAAIRYPSDRKYKRGIRGKITDFSDASRVRLFDLVHRLDVKRKPIFLTLTYGEEYPDAETAKEQLKTLLERVRRRVDGLSVSAIWRMEFQERGAPHFHIIFFDLPFVDKLTWQYWWEEITGTPEPFTRVERVRSHRSLMSYISKYIAKVDKAEKTGFISPTYLHAYKLKYGEYVGRQWGVFQRQHLPFAELFTYERDYTRWAFDQFRAMAIANFPPIASYLSQGFRLYVKDALQWRDIARYLFDKPSKTVLLSRLTRSDIPLTL